MVRNRWYPSPTKLIVYTLWPAGGRNNAIVSVKVQNWTFLHPASLQNEKSSCFFYIRDRSKSCIIIIIRSLYLKKKWADKCFYKKKNKNTFHNIVYTSVLIRLNKVVRIWKLYHIYYAFPTLVSVKY